MARIFVDSNIFGEQWFQDNISRLMASGKVRFAYTDHEKLTGEGERCRKLMVFYKIARDRGLRDDISIADCEKHINFLTNKEEWQNEKACDDEHVFAMNYIKPIAYVITADRRMAKCRDCLNLTLDKNYCGFRVIGDQAKFEEHWHRISA